MKKPELLSPAGNMESLKAAISAGCDAIYLGGYLFGARNYANNFSNEELKEAVSYAHLYNVKVYVTINTLVYENEIETFLNYIDFLYHANVDALIIQDLGMMDVIRKTYPDFELHASTQMHIHTKEGVNVCEKLGLKRVVLVRETPIEVVKEIKKNTSLELEIFVHGALCISYSGQCFMSSFIGGRSGNRGTCAQCCRQKYKLVKKENNNFIPIKEGYLLSTRDLNTLDHLKELIESGVDSFKIEGRMKRPEYVYFVTSLYRKAIDSYFETGTIVIKEEDIYELKKIFNRTFTKGFLFHEENSHFTHIDRPNHMGVPIGKVISVNGKKVSILLSDEVSIQDGIRILGPNDYGMNLNEFYKKKKLVKEAYKNDVITLEVKEKIQNGSIVVKTTDSKLMNQIQKEILEKKRKVKIVGICEIKENMPLKLTLKEGMHEVTFTSNYIPSIALNHSTEKERILEQLKKLGNTCYEFQELTLSMDENLFISIKEINELRRKAFELLDETRLKRVHLEKQNYEITLPDFQRKKEFTFYARNKNSYEKHKLENFHTIYMEESIKKEVNDERVILKLPRIMKNYPNYEKKVLVGEIGSLFQYPIFETDFSFHVTNSYTLAFLHSLGSKKVTLSYELNFEQTKELLEGYQNRYHKHPNVELIISGYLEAMIMKYNLFEDYHLTNEVYLVDRFQNYYLVENKKDYAILYHYQKREIKNYEDYYKIGVNSFRIED